MKSGGLFVLGGLLSGIGHGMQDDIVQQRQMALEALRRQDAADARLDAQKSSARELDTRHSNAIEMAGIEQKNRIDTLQTSGSIQTERDAVQHTYELDTARVRARLQMATDAASIALRDRLSDRDVHGVEVDGNGNYVVIRNDGTMERTDVTARAPASASNATEGGRLTQDERDAAYSEAHRAWIQGGRQGREPQRTDFIGVTRDDYRAGQSGGGSGTGGGTRRIRFDAQGRRING